MDFGSAGLVRLLQFEIFEVDAFFVLGCLDGDLFLDFVGDV